VLAELHIRDFAIIDDLQLSFAPGFSVLTGETGAGKSIIVDAVDLVLGGRADSTVVRAGARRALVEAVFRLNSRQRAALAPLLEREGLEADDVDLLLLGREVRLNGRNICRINGRSVPLRLLREVAEGLVDIHGQSEHLSLLRPREQLALLDRYGGLEPLCGRVAELVRRLRQVRRELAGLTLREQELVHRADLLRFQVDEISAAALRLGEEEELLEERLRLANAEQLAALSGEALRVLEDGGEGGLALQDLLGATLRTLEALARIDWTLEPQVRVAENLSYQVEDLVRSLRDYQDRIEHNPQRLQAVEDRIALLRRLERKYGQTVADVLAYAEKAERELDGITYSEERIAQLQVEEERLLGELGAQAVALSSRRQETAQRLAAAVEDELQDLRMEGARFGVGFEWRIDPRGVPLPDVAPATRLQVSGIGVEVLERVSLEPEAPLCVAFDASGIDRVEFLVSPNPGEPLRPMTKTASGGETARLMLALKAVLSRADETPTLVFDEIDQGIGGRVGATVGGKLWGLTRGRGGEERQVLCVTHLPQLASFGDVHFHVEKVVRGARTVTRVRQLDGAARVEEIAQMLGASGEAGYRSAEEILDQVTRQKARRLGSPSSGDRASGMER